MDEYKDLKKRLHRLIEDVEEKAQISLEAFNDDADRYRLGKYDAYTEILSDLQNIDMATAKHEPSDFYKSEQGR